MKQKLTQSVVDDALFTDQVVDKLSSAIQLQNTNNLSNAPYFGRGTDYSKNSLRSSIQNQFPLVNWLLNTSLSQMIESAWNNGSLPTVRDTNGDTYLQAPLSVFTEPPKDTTGECCWLPFDINACGGKAPMNILCLKDCVDMIDFLLERKLKVQANDLIGMIKQPGQTYKEVRDFINRESMAFYTANTIINGQVDVETPALKKFHGLLEILKRPEVVKYPGFNILAGFDALRIRMNILGGNYAFSAHPLVVDSIRTSITPNCQGVLPYGWSKNGDDIFFHGAPFIEDTHMPIDLESGTGTVVMLASDAVGVFLATTLRPGEDYIIRNQFTTNTNIDKGCATECDIYYNMGTVVTNNPAKLGVLTDVPLSPSINGVTLQGLLGKVYRETLIP